MREDLLNLIIKIKRAANLSLQANLEIEKERQMYFEFIFTNDANLLPQRKC